MTKELEFDLSKLVKALGAGPEAIATAGRYALQDVMDDWKREAIDVAPIDKSTLRRSISYRTTRKGTTGVNVEGTLTATAIETSDKFGRFNYAYYIHEVLGDSFNGKTPGTVGRFLDVPAEQHEAEWMKYIEQEIERRLRSTTGL